MNALLLSGLALLGLGLGYVFYSRGVRRWLGVNEDVAPPSVALRDGVDYVPAKHWTILFGHHFASIAGAAPIIGPVLACLYWGWLPAVVWIVVGGVFFGAVHDYFALTASAENRGRSVSDLSESVLGKAAKVVFSLFVLLALILVVAVFAAVAGKTLASTPQVVVPTFGLVLVAMLVGLLVYHTSVPVAVDTVIGLALLFGLIVLGYYVPVSLPVAQPEKWWTALLLLYGMTAAVLPVSLLLQPRDHLAAGVLFLGMLCGFAGILVSRPVLHSPAFVAFSGGPGWLWPMLFVTVACGAISGFHSLIASGTTSKQLPRMSDARRIGYGAMIAECALAVLAVCAVTAGLYWKHAPAGMEGLVYQDVMAKGGWIKAFGEGYGQLTRSIFGALGVLVGITMLKTFVMTTLDSATRITRYVAGELLGDTFHLRLFRNRYFTTLVVGGCAAYLALGNWRAIWPVFGAANQLIAAMVLIIATAYLMTRRRPCLFTAVPAVLLLATTIGALVYQTAGFLRPAAGGRPNYLLGAIAVALICLAAFVVYRGGACVLAAAGRRSDSGAD